MLVYTVYRDTCRCKYTHTRLTNLQEPVKRVEKQAYVWNRQKTSRNSTYCFNGGSVLGGLQSGNFLVRGRRESRRLGVKPPTWTEKLWLGASFCRSTVVCVTRFKQGQTKAENQLETTYRISGIVKTFELVLKLSNAWFEAQFSLMSTFELQRAFPEFSFEVGNSLLQLINSGFSMPKICFSSVQTCLLADQRFLQKSRKRHLSRKEKNLRGYASGCRPGIGGGTWGQWPLGQKIVGSLKIVHGIFTCWVWGLLAIDSFKKKKKVFVHHRCTK